MEMFDTTYPLNGLFWFLVWLLCGGRLLNLKYRDPNGLGRLSFKEMTGNDI